MQRVVCPTVDGGTEEVERNDTGPFVLTRFGVHLVRVWKIPNDLIGSRRKASGSGAGGTLYPAAKGSARSMWDRTLPGFLLRRELVELIRCCWPMRSTWTSGNSNAVVLCPSLPS